MAQIQTEAYLMVVLTGCALIITCVVCLTTNTPTYVGHADCMVVTHAIANNTQPGFLLQSDFEATYLSVHYGMRYFKI